MRIVYLATNNPPCSCMRCPRLALFTLASPRAAAVDLCTAHVLEEFEHDVNGSLKWEQPILNNYTPFGRYVREEAEATRRRIKERGHAFYPPPQRGAELPAV